MAERSRTIAVGATMLVGLLGLLAMLYLFGNVPDWLGRTYQVTLKLPSAAGVSPGSRVFLSGIDVGQVESVSFEQPISSGVRVVCRIRQDVPIPAQAQAHVDQPLIGGSPRITLVVPERVATDELTYLPRDGTAELRGDVPTLAGTFGHEVRQALAEPVEHLERATDHFESLSVEWQRVGQNVNLLLEPRQPNQSNPDEAAEAVANLPDTLAELEARLQQLEPVLDGAQRYLDDDELYADVRATAANARQVSEDLQTNVADLSASLDRHMDELTHRYIALADDLSGGVQAMERVLSRIEAGEGTLGLLVNDPRLYESMVDAVEHIQMTIDAARLTIEKWRVEGMPVQW